MEPWRQEAARAASQAKVSGRGNRYTDGAYELVIDEMYFKDGHRGLSFIAKFFVEKSRNTEPGIEARPAGSRFDVVYNYRSSPEMAPVNVKALILAVAGLTEQQVDAKQAEEDAAAQRENRDARDVAGTIILEATNTNPEYGKPQPFKGYRVIGETFRIETRKQEGKNLPRSEWFCGMDFRHVPGQTQETIADGIAKLNAIPSAPAPSQTPAAPPAPPAQGFQGAAATGQYDGHPAVSGGYSPPPAAPTQPPPPPSAAPPADPPAEDPPQSPPAGGSMLGSLGI